MILLAHVMPWFGDGNIHRQTSYLSNDAGVITRQIQIMQGSKINNEILRGVIMTWQGPLATFQHSTATQWSAQCAAHRMLFCLLLDPWAGRLGSGGSATQNIINALNDPTAQTMLNASSYLPEKFVLDFSTGADLGVLGSTFPTLKFLQEGVGFSWPSIPSITDSASRNAASVSDLHNQNSNHGMKIPGFLGMRFNDSGYPTPSGVSLSAWTGTRDYNTSVWGGAPNRVLDDQAGKLFLDQWGVTPVSTPYAAVVTWNDYDEGTAIEPYCAAALGVRIGS